MKSRYCYCPMTAKKIGRRVTLMDRFRRWRNRKDRPDVFQVTGYYNAYYPGK